MTEFEYLVTYGHGAYLGRFHSAAAYARGGRVVVRSDRGLETGTVLERATTFAVADVGAILRPVTAEDEATVTAHRERASAILADAEAAAATTGLPLLFLDAEILLDGSQAILQAVHWDECDATLVFDGLTTRHGLPVKLADMTAAPARGCPTCGAEKQGCDSCGSGTGCSSGSCSSGSVKSAGELTAYFAGLRRQMEAASARVSLH